MKSFIAASITETDFSLEFHVKRINLSLQNPVLSKLQKYCGKIARNCCCNILPCEEVYLCIG